MTVLGALWLAVVTPIPALVACNVRGCGESLPWHLRDSLSLSIGQHDDVFMQKGLRKNAVMHPALFCFLVMPLRRATRVPIPGGNDQP